MRVGNQSGAAAVGSSGDASELPQQEQSAAPLASARDEFDAPSGKARNAAARNSASAASALPKIPSGELKLGHHGGRVRQLQELLVHVGLPSKTDMATGPGIYGPHTQAALAKLQHKYGITGNDGSVFGKKTHDALKKELAKLDGTGGGTGTGTHKPTKGAGDPRIVKTAIEFWQKGHYDAHTRNDNWEGWCLSFVRTVNRVATGKDDPQLVADTAAESAEKMRKAGRLNPLKKSDWPKLVPGAAIYWGPRSDNPAGHVCIFSGKYTKDGDPICITSGGWRDDKNGISKKPLSEIIAAEGMQPLGWAALK